MRCVSGRAAARAAPRRLCCGSCACSRAGWALPGSRRPTTGVESSKRRVAPETCLKTCKHDGGLLRRATPGAWVVRASQHTDKTPVELAKEVRRLDTLRPRSCCARVRGRPPAAAHAGARAPQAAPVRQQARLPPLPRYREPADAAGPRLTWAACCAQVAREEALSTLSYPNRVLTGSLLHSRWCARTYSPPYPDPVLTQAKHCAPGGAREGVPAAARGAALRAALRREPGGRVSRRLRAH